MERRKMNRQAWTLDSIAGPTSLYGEARDSATRELTQVTSTRGSLERDGFRGEVTTFFDYLPSTKVQDYAATVPGRMQLTNIIAHFEIRRITRTGLKHDMQSVHEQATETADKGLAETAVSLNGELRQGLTLRSESDDLFVVGERNDLIVVHTYGKPVVEPRLISWWPTGQL